MMSEPRGVDAFAEAFSDFFYQAVLLAGGSRATAHKCLAEWWRAVEERQSGADEEE